MVKKKSQSHRQSLKLKYLVQKKSVAHRKKIKKMALQNPHLNQKKSRKDPGIPNLWPFKEQLMKKILKDKEEMEMQKRNKNVEMVQNTLNNATNDDMYMEPEVEEEKEYKNDNKIQSGNYFRELKKVLEESDVILQVLDARDPMGCRCKEFEERIGASSKKLVLVLNKIDLVPQEVVQKWITLLRKEFPTVAFKASTQSQKNNISVFGKSFAQHTSLSKSEALSLSGCVGASELMQLLKNYTRSLNKKTAITVGIIGYPNVGKSSLINSLKRGKAAGVGSTPGFTKCVQEVHIDSKIKLLDSPGVLLDVKNTGESVLALRNSVSVTKIEDPIFVVQQLLEKVPVQTLAPIYHIQRVNTCEEFLLKVAAKKGKLKKGGVADLEQTALAVLQDWNDGMIPFYVQPPEESVSMGQATIVEGDCPEFDPLASSAAAVLPAEEAEELGYAIDGADDQMDEDYDFEEHFDDEE